MENFPGKPKLSRRREQRVERAIDGLESPLREILLRISTQIERGEYNAIIGVDASARIPALVVAGVIKNRYKAHGYQNPNVLFIAGASKRKIGEAKFELKQEMISQYVQELIARKELTSEKKALVVEDTAITGESARLISDSLIKNGIPNDVIIVAGSSYSANEWSEKIGTTVYSTRDFETSTYGKNDMAGVKKDHSDLFSEPHILKDGNLVLNEARERIAHLVEKLTPNEST